MYHIRLTKAVLTVTTLAFVLSNASHAATYHVSPFGSNTLPYSSYESAATRPEPAFMLATNPSDTVWIHTGTYEVDSTIDIDRGVTIRGDGQDSSTLLWSVGYERFNFMLNVGGDNDVFDLRFVEDQHGYRNRDPEVIHRGGLSDVWLRIRKCRIEGMTLDLGGSGVREVFDCYFYLRSALGCRIPSTGGSVSIHNNLFFAGVGSEVQASTGVFAGGSRATIENNIFDFSQSGNRGIPILVERPFGSVEVRNNLLLGGDRATVWDNGSGVFENNTIVGPHEDFHPSDGTFFYIDDVHSVAVRNNAWIDNGFLVGFGNLCDDCPPASGFTYQYNTFWPLVDSFYRYPDDINPIVVYVDTIALFNAFPMIADSLYRLQYGSPLIDAGDPNIIDPDGSRSDIGWTGGPGGMMYEYVNLAPLPPDSISVTGLDTFVTVEWDFRPESDTDGYRVYRGHTSGFWNASLVPYRELGTDARSLADTLDRTSDTVVYVLTCFDKTGQESAPSDEASFVISNNQPNHPPVFDPTDDRTVRAGDTLTITVTAIDIDGDSLSFTLIEKPNGIDIVDQDGASATLRFVPEDDQIGLHSVVVEATDGIHLDTVAFSVSVTERGFTTEDKITRVYPNPVRGQATIEVSVSGFSRTDAVPVALVVHDIAGRTVATVFEGYFTPGIQSVSWDDGSGVPPASLAGGIYLLRLNVDGRMRGELYKLALLK